MEKVSLVGLGKLGLSLLATIGASGRSVLGVDIDDHVVSSVNKGIPPLHEPDLQEMLQEQAGKNLTATVDIKRAVSETDYTIILVQTPSESDGRYGTGALMGVLKELCSEISRTNKKGHLISVNSTIQPGSMDGEIIPYIEQATGCKNGEDIFVCYNPEMVALGTTIKNFQYPDFVLIGANDETTINRVKALQESFIKNSADYKIMSAVSAEIVKISLNTYLTVKISFANLISQMSSQIPKSDIDDIMEAIGSDSRIGKKFIKAGNSFGGTCFPRDVYAFRCFLNDTDIGDTLTTAVNEINKAQSDLLIDLVSREMKQTSIDRVVVLGQSFKPDTHVIAESSSIMLIQALQKTAKQIVTYDPYAVEAVKKKFGYAVEYADSAHDAIRSKAIIVVYNPVKEFLEALKYAQAGSTIIDCWRAVEREALPADVRYVAFGNYN